MVLLCMSDFQFASWIRRLCVGLIPLTYCYVIIWAKFGIEDFRLQRSGYTADGTLLALQGILRVLGTSGRGGGQGAESHWANGTVESLQLCSSETHFDWNVFCFCLKIRIKAIFSFSENAYFNHRVYKTWRYRFR